MAIAVRRLQFCAGHRVWGHESKCANMHGHNYEVFIHVRTKQLDEIGRVIDFSVLKERFGNWIEQHWDHGFLYNEKDNLCQTAFSREGMNQMKTFVCKFNPTAEEMARHLLVISKSLMQGTGVEVFKIVLWETENCYAEVTL